MARVHLIFLLLAAFAMMAYANPMKEANEEEQEEIENKDSDDVSLLDLMDKSRRPACSNRKCLRWYRGWWTKNCRARVVAYCEKDDKYCCAHECEAKGWCPTGACVSDMSECPNGIVKDGCRGRQCYCCAVS